MPGARSVKSNQDGIHQDLEKMVRRYASTEYLRPFAEHTRNAFLEAENFVNAFYSEQEAANADCSEKPLAPFSKAYPVILDSGCGTGESTLHIAQRFPTIPVIGIDKSENRLAKAKAEGKREGAIEIPRNAFWIRAELLDFWRLASENIKSGKWEIPYHAVFYPNPWPKQSEATRRFHMHPIFPVLMELGKVTELRTNWEIYAQEFAEASRLLANIQGRHSQISLETFSPEHPETAFERKYKEARQELWRVVVSC